MEVSYAPRSGNRIEPIEAHWIDIKHELIRPDGSWDISSQTVCTIEVSGKGAKSARFFVVVGLDHSGKPWASITGRKSGDKDTTKTVFASWLDFAARAVARIGGGK